MFSYFEPNFIEKFFKKVVFQILANNYYFVLNPPKFMPGLSLHPHWSTLTSIQHKKKLALQGI